MSSNNFLQRFKGKTQTVSKQGVHNILGGKNQDVIVYTNTNLNFNHQSKNQHSLNKSKPAEEQKKSEQPSYKKIGQNAENNKPKQSIKSSLGSKETKEKVDNPFLISNPFYLDEQEREKQQMLKKQRQKEQKLEKQKEKQVQRSSKDIKKSTHGSINKSLQKKGNKQWVKLGGLGANIGGDEWVEKKKKLDKMQEFSEQVKSINADKPKVPKPSNKEDKKQPNPRQKALQYSKNVPKPTIRPEREVTPEQKEAESKEEMSELQKYAMRHQELKNRIKNQI